MMADFNTVLDVLECHDSASDFRLVGDGFAGWEDVF